MNLPKLFLWITVSAISLSVNAQLEKLEIIYERKFYWTKMYDKLDFLSEEEKTKQKLVWGKRDGRSENYNLKITPSASLYTYGDNESENTYSWKRDEFLLLHELQDNKLIQQRVVGGKLLVIEDESPQIKWKIHNEIRQVANYLCMKAVTQDTIKNQEITAWFTTEIPISTGPEGLSGLPGLILMVEINDGTMVLEATKIKALEGEIERPKKIKGKKLNLEDYNAIVDKYFKESVERKRNPFWGMRY